MSSGPADHTDQPQPRPELLFVAGPQAGRRVVLMGNVATAGRSPATDVQLTEQYASRKHLRIELTPDGWVAENLSPGGTRINEKNYKRGKKVLLATGDVFGVGLATQILFVSAEDDPNEALAAYRQAHPEPPARPRQEPPETQAEAASPSPTAPVPKETAPTPESAQQAAPEEPPPAAEDKAKRAKLKRYGIGLAVYAVIILAVVVLIVSLKGNGITGPSDQPYPLRKEQISDAIASPLKRTKNSTAAAAALDDALRLYRDRKVRPGNLYWVTKNFKLYLAFKRGAGFDNVDHEDKFDQAKSELINLVWEECRNGWAYEQAKDWRRALEIFEGLLVALPEREQGDPVYEKIVKNIMAHRAYIRGRMPTKKK